jgi:hypothetical protein
MSVSGARSVDPLPIDGIFLSVFEFADSQTAIALSRLSRHCYALCSPDQIRDRVINPKYPREMVQLFGHCNLSLGRLPVLDLGATNRDYVDWLENLPRPIMRFRDVRRRYGIAVQVEMREDVRATDRHEVQPRAASGVFTIFQRAGWRVGMGGALSLFEPSLMSGSPVDYEFLSTLLRGAHPIYRIAHGYTPPEAAAGAGAANCV